MYSIPAGRHGVIGATKGITHDKTQRSASGRIS